MPPFNVKESRSVDILRFGTFKGKSIKMTRGLDALESRMGMGGRATRFGKSELPSVHKLEEYSVCIVLTKVIEKLGIIQYLLPDPETEGHEPYQVISTRMTTLKKTKPPEDLEDERTEALKHIQKCRHMSQEALKKVVQGCKGSEGMIHYLKEILTEEHLRYYDNFYLKQENLNLNNLIRNLNNKINEVKKNSRETSLYLDKMTQFCLQQAATTVWAQSKTLKKNTEVFQQAQIDLNNYRLREKEDNIISTREQCDSETTRETIINNEIINYLQSVTDNLQRKLEKWTARYSEEVDSLDIALLQLRSKMEEQQEKFGTMSQQHAARQELVEVLQEEADQRDREQAERMVLSKAAIIVQQWWRKVLLMRQVKKAARLSIKKKTGKKLSPPIKKKK